MAEAGEDGSTAGGRGAVTHWCSLTAPSAIKKLKSAAPRRTRKRWAHGSRGTEMSSASASRLLWRRNVPPVVQRPNRRAKAGKPVFPEWTGRRRRPGICSVTSSMAWATTADVPDGRADVGRERGTGPGVSGRATCGCGAAIGADFRGTTCAAGRCRSRPMMVREARGSLDPAPAGESAGLLPVKPMMVLLPDIQDRGYRGGSRRAKAPDHTAGTGAVL